MRPASAGSIRADTRGEDERHWRTAAGDAPANHLGASRPRLIAGLIRIKPHHFLRRPVPIAPPSRTQPRTSTMAGDGKSDTPWTESAAATFDG